MHPEQRATVPDRRDELSNELPSVRDPILVSANDGTLFVCWIEHSTDQRHWIFMRLKPPDRYIGPGYGGEDSPEMIKDLLNRWWDDRAVVGQQGASAEKTSGWTHVGFSSIERRCSFSRLPLLP